MADTGKGVRGQDTFLATADSDCYRTVVLRLVASLPALIFVLTFIAPSFPRPAPIRPRRSHDTLGQARSEAVGQIGARFWPTSGRE